MSDTSEAPKHPAEPKETPATAVGGDAMFSGPAEEPSHRGMILGILALAIVAIIGGLLVRGHDTPAALPPNTILPADPAARALVFSQLAMSQSTSLSGGTSTFLDGHIKNTGTATLTAATVQVVFRNDVGLSPQVESLPLSIIRMRQPYIDTAPVSTAPIKPGQEVEFRLIFESIPDNWNQQMPELQVIHASFQ